jgi:phage terminase large subunit
LTRIILPTLKTDERLKPAALKPAAQARAIQCSKRKQECLAGASTFAQRPKPEEKAYLPQGAACRLWSCQQAEIVISGPAGSGKSRACLEKLHFLAEKYAKMRGLIVRKSRASLTESALVTFEEKVVPVHHPILSGPGRARRQAYRYPNGSILVLAGLDKVGRVMSTDYDLVLVQEAIELAVGDWEALMTRLRNGVLPFQQIIADTNPDTPTHWLKRRYEAGKAILLESRHEDNPLLWDRRRQDWTEAGRDYLSRLDALTGARKQRLRYGRWVQAEGVVYDGFDRSIHLIDRFKIPADWPRFWSVDFGYTNPLVCQWWAQDPDGRLYLYRQIYRSRRLVEDHARQMLALSRDEPRPICIICDHDAEDRATLERYLNMQTVEARKDKSPGIQAVASRLMKVGDGKPRLFFLRDSLVEHDPRMIEQKKPGCTEEEFDGYIWDPSNNRKEGEEPVDRDNHGMDALRYLVAHFDLE